MKTRAQLFSDLAADIATNGAGAITADVLQDFLADLMAALPSSIGAAIALTYASTTNTDAALGCVFDLTLTGNVTLANPTNPVDGQAVKWRIRQDATGGRTVALGSKFRIPATATSPLAWSTAASKLDIFAAIYNLADDKWDVISMVPGY